uniref:alpha-tectorin-like isoform X3 n=1 Tax=Semicossyphus pulcher TaxID=241346 RepID=UPI0037E75E0D
MATQLMLPVLLLGMISTVTLQTTPPQMNGGTVTPQATTTTQATSQVIGGPTTPQPTSPSNPQVTGGPLYPIAGTTTNRVLHGSSPLIHLQQPFVYFGQSYNQIYVNNNGYLTFNYPWYSNNPQMFPMHGSRDIIAPFWTDFDNRQTGWVYYNQYTNGSVLHQATQDINNYFPELNFNASWVFVATWYEVAYFSNTGTKTTVQAVLISGGQYSFVLMNYGIIAPPVHNVQAGYDTVNSQYHFSVPGSFSNNITGNNSSVQQSSNVNELGRWAFRIDNGSRGCVFNCPTTPQPTPPSNPQVTGGPLYPIAGTTTNRVLHGSSPLIHLQQPFVYFGQSYNQIYVNNNGHLTFNSQWHSYTPQMFPMHGSRDIIAPFWTDFDNRQTGWVYYNQYTNGSVLHQATQDINNYFPELNFNASWVFVATWYEVAYFSNTGTKTTVQAVLISGGQYSFVLMNYGIIAPPVHNVQAGYDTVNSQYHFSVPGSFSNNSTGNNSSVQQSSNVNKLGRWAFRIDNGSRGCVFNCPTTPQPTPPSNPQVTGGPLYPIAGTTTNRVLHGSSPLIHLQQPFVYFGQSYNQIYVNNNGYLTFNYPWYSNNPQMFPMHGSTDIIAPFWTDFDNRQTGWVYYNQYTNGSVLHQATQDINNYFPELNFNASWVFVATWYEVAYYSNTGTKTTVQAVLISGGQYSFVLMNYGIIAPPVHNVQAGYDTAHSPYHFSVPGSFSHNATSNNSSNVHVPGRWAFRIDNGSRTCTFNGQPVQLGESFWSDSTCAQKCTCTSAGLQCHSQPCSFSQICQPTIFQFSCQTVQKQTCTISGDPHYYTFDGKVFHFQGTCTYVLSEQCGPTLPYFRVEGKNEHRGSTHVSWTRLVKVFVYNETIELVKGHPGEAKVNGHFAATPISINNGTIQVYESGFSVIISTDFGLEVSYDTNHYARISLPNTYQNATCGLCGNLNNNPGDDFRTRQGKVVSSDVVFANSWQAASDDEPGCEVQCGGLGCAACTEDQTALYSNADHCGILKNSSGPFTACHQQLPPEDFLESCVYDLCVGGGYQPILCHALNAYASQCQQFGIQLPSWRSQGFCEIQCPSNSHFESQGTGCPATCVNPNSTHNCPLPDQESCICDSGYILSGGVCVPHAECGCSFEGRYYRSGETVILDEDCGRLCSCSYGFMTCSYHSCGPLESCSVVDGERGCRPNSYATCWLKGTGSYHTFDGKTYQYPGACRLTLAKVMGLSNHPHFMVTTEKVPRGQQGFASVLSFEAEGTQISIEMTGSSRVQVDGQLIRLPFSSASKRIQIYHSSIHSIILRTSFGVTAQTVWPNYVRVTAPGIYNGSLGGLCGNYNGHLHDDFRTPNGNLVNSAQVFGESWRDGSLAAHCVESINHNSTTNKSSQDCGILGSPHGPFAQCWAMEPTQQHLDACVDIIEASPDPASELCNVLQDYALMCQQKGVSLGHWRNATDCAQICPLNSHYELCGSSCPAACPSLSFPFSCDTVCQEGCQCDDGFVLNGNQCVLPTDCGCYHQGRYRQGGEQFWDGEECQSLCSCSGSTGVVHCIPNSCGAQESCRVVEGEFGCHPNPHGICSASGDPHYFSFDGKTFDFQGTCRYVLATLCNATDGHQFSVEAKNEPWNGFPVSITAEVFVDVWGHEVHMSGNNNGMVEVNGITTNLPVFLNGGQVSIYASGSRTFVTADFGLSVTYDGWSTVTISVPSNYSGQTCGLCGNFNGDPNDDYKTPSGMMVATPDEFGKAWKVAGNYTCSDGCGSSCPKCSNEQPARAQCEVIQAADGPFSFCHGQVDPAPYFNDCVFDVCVSGDEGQDLLCRDIQAYVTACQSANVRIYPWRENTTCKLECPDNSHYELCGTDCGHTCASSIDATCEQVCSEGCFCDKGFVRSGTKCVPVETCGCQYDGYYYNAGESFWTEGCSQHCKCHAPNDLRCSAASCTPAEECTIRNGHLGCFNAMSAMSTCTVWGDPHYSCFDGALAHFQGTCSYIITESVSHGINETQFQVVATNNHRGNNRVSFVSAVDVYLSNEPESEHIRIGPNKIVKVNGSRVSLPTTAGTLAQVTREGSFIEVNAGDLIVQFDGHSTLLVRIGKNLYSKVKGLCGNFNGDPSDDKVLPNGTLAQNDYHFGHSWKSITSQPGCGSTDDVIGDGLDDCPLMQKYSELCSVITNTSGPFSACHPHSDPQTFFSSCVYDLCLYTPAYGLLCSAVSAYEATCSTLGLDIPEWRSTLHCAESDPCDLLDCTEDEWCGEKHGVYGCFCDEDHHRPNSESYDSSITCVSSSATMSLSRCQLFEAGFHPSTLHLRDHSCNGTIQNGRLVFNFNNEDHLCGTNLRSNGTHIIYENTIRGNVDTHGGVISREKNLDLAFCCNYPLSQALSMGIGINPVESIVNRKLHAGVGQYKIRIIPYRDAGYHSPLTGHNITEMEIDQKIYVEVRTEGVDKRQISTVLDSCWATPVNIANFPVRWDLIIAECPNPEDGTVEMVQNGISTVSRFSFRMFTFTNFTSVYLHCQVHLCLLKDNNCSTHCSPGHHLIGKRDVSYHDTTDISVGPIVLRQERSIRRGRRAPRNSASGQLTSMVTLLVSLLTAKALI